MTIIINILFQSTSMVSSHLVVKSSDYDVAGASLAPDGSGKKMEYGGEKVVAHIIALRASVRMAVTANPGTLAAFAQSRGFSPETVKTLRPDDVRTAVEAHVRDGLASPYVLEGSGGHERITDMD